MNVFKSKIDELDIGKVKTNPTGSNKLSNVVKMKLLKRLYMMNLPRKVNDVDTNVFVKKEILIQRSKILKIILK